MIECIIRLYLANSFSVCIFCILFFFLAQINKIKTTSAKLIMQLFSLRFDNLKNMGICWTKISFFLLLDDVSVYSFASAIAQQANSIE